MAFEEIDRVAIRRYLGFAAIFVQAEPRLENAINTVQSVADGGTRPDNTTETAVRSYLAKLAIIEAKLEELWDCVDSVQVDKIQVDPVRGMAMLRMEGRRMVGYLADALSTRPVRDVFSAPGLMANGPTFTRTYLDHVGAA